MTSSSTTELAALLDGMRARQQTRIDTLAQLTDERLTAACIWAAQDVDVRFMLLRIAFHEDEHTRHLVKTLGWLGHQPTETHQVLGAAQAGRGELLGALIGLEDADLERVPTEPAGEWSLGTTLAHVLQVERSYRSAIATDVGIARSGAEWHAHERVATEEPLGSLAEALERLNSHRATTIEQMQDIAPAELDAKSVWMGVPLTVRFRILLLGYHMQEHAEHIRKWRGQVGREMSEAQVLLARLAVARGATEAALVGVPDHLLDVDPGNGEWTLRQILEHVDLVQDRLMGRMLGAT